MDAPIPRRIKASLAALSSAVVLCACGPGGDADEPPTEFQPVASVHDLMHDVIYPRAESFWDSVGTIIDAEGTHEIRPANEAEWEVVVQSALTLAEAGNLLMLEGREGRGADSEGWSERASSLTAAAVLGVEAARGRDAEAVFEIGGTVYAACTDCHEQFWEKPPSAMRP